MLPLLVGGAAESSVGQRQELGPELDPRAAVATLAREQAEWGQRIEGLAEQLAEHVARDDVGGMAVGVVADGEMVWAEGFGWSDRDARERMEPSAVFRTGSVSKTVTAMVLMRLVDRGVVGLDGPVGLYLPEMVRVRDRMPGDPEVTFRHLASHTAGLERNYREGLATPVDQWQEGVLQSLGNIAFGSVPGARYQDSPLGYGALALALERAAGRPFVQLVQTEVFDPLGMTSSSYSVVGSNLEARLATAYPNRRDGTFEAGATPRRFGGWGYTLPSGGMYSTVGDLGRLLGAIAGVPSLRILSESSRRELITVQTPGGIDPPLGPGVPRNGTRVAVFRDGDGNNIRSPEVLDPPQGLGLAIHLDRGGNQVVHMGGLVAGYTAYMAVDLETRIGVVMLRNYWRGTTELRRGALGLVAQLSTIVRGRSSFLDSVPPILVFAMALLLVGALFKPLRRMSEVPERRRR